MEKNMSDEVSVSENEAEQVITMDETNHPSLLETEIQGLRQDNSLLRAAIGVILHRDFAETKELLVSTAELTEIMNMGYQLHALTNTEIDPNNFLHFKLVKAPEEVAVDELQVEESAELE